MHGHERYQGCSQRMERGLEPDPRDLVFMLVSFVAWTSEPRARHRESECHSKADAGDMLRRAPAEGQPLRRGYCGSASTLKERNLAYLLPISRACL